MALSQKYDGLALVPWFNLDEWKSVKQLIYSDNLESQQVAVNRMKIWKLRTHQLPVGIYGTLELLEALLAERDIQSEDQLVRIYSFSLLRFLNICAANNDKQGTFYKTAEKNGIPLWLISLRHDIAHDPTIPSKRFLKKALIECLHWVKENYWEVSQMEDVLVLEETNFKELIHDYSKLKVLNFFNENINLLIDEIQKKNQFPISVGGKSGLTSDDFINFLEDHLIQSVTQDKIKDSCVQIVSTVIEEGFLFTINYNCIHGVKRIPLAFLEMWQKLLNLLYENGTLFLLINKLASVTVSTTYENTVKEISSLWIAELYRGLLKTLKMKSKCDNSHPFRDTLTFPELEVMPMEDSKLFQERILEAPNELTLNFLELVLRFNGNTESDIKRRINVIKNFVQFSTAYYTDSVAIYSVSDLKDLVDSHHPELVQPDTTMQQIDNKSEHRIKFRELSDAEKFRFKCYPLGYMPQK